MRNYQVFMPTDKRVYNAYMPTDKRVYNVFLPDLPVVETCQEVFPNLIPNPKDFTGWTTTGVAVVSPNVSISPGQVQDADRLSMDGASSSIAYEDTAFVADALLDLQIWVKRVGSYAPGDEVKLSNPYSGVDGGDWRIDLTHPNLADWTLLTDAHPAVLVVNQMKIEGTGRLAIAFSPDTASGQASLDAWCIDMRYQ